MSCRVKTPVIIQMEMLECGAASLAMILAFYGKWLPLEKVRADCGVSRDGSKAKNILLAARRYGLDAYGYRGEMADIKKAKFPCIVHWNFNHFVVLNGFSSKHAYLNDPARGAIRVSLEEFDQAFTGIFLMFSPTDAFVPEGKPKSIFSFVQSRMKGTAASFVFISLTTLILGIIAAVNAALSGVFLDQVLGRQNPQWLTPMLIGMTMLAALAIIITLVNSIYLLKLQGKLAIVANSTFFWHVLRLPMSFFSQRLAGDLATRQELNKAVAETLIAQIVPLLLNIVLMIFYFLIMLRYSVYLTLIGLLAIAINMGVSAIISQKRINITRVQMRDAGKLTSMTLSGVEMIETIKASGAENGFFEQWSGTQAAVNTSRTQFAKTNLYLGAIPPLVSSLASVTVLVSGAGLILQGEFSTGMLLAFQGYLLGFTTPVQSLIALGQSLQEMRVSMERIDDVMRYPPDSGETLEKNHAAPDALHELDKLKGAIKIQKLSFGYSSLEPPLIRDFSLAVKPGGSVALVGESGCGKSTLANLISGLYQPWEGEISFDGRLRKEYPREVLTSSISVVNQDIILFEDTVDANVRLWDGSIEAFEVLLACRDAGIHHDILKRTGGYRHKLSEGGKNLSGGQRQRLEIARALAVDPVILILDEATSALDAQTESEITTAIRNRGITTVIIAHRLSTIRDCDEIIVLDRGAVAERGTHDELIKKNGYYARLLQTS